MGNDYDCTRRTHVSPIARREEGPEPVRPEVDLIVDAVEIFDLSALAAELQLHRAGATIGGLVEGATGIKGHLEPGFEGWYTGGHVAGATAGLLADAASMVAGSGMTVGGAAACGSGVLCFAGAPAIVGGASLATAGAGAVAMVHGPEMYEGLREIFAKHHIMTNKHFSERSGGPWTPRFKAIADKAGMSLNDVENIVDVYEHHGPHDERLHKEVYRRALNAIYGVRGKAQIREALVAELRRMAAECKRPGSYLNRLITEYR